ncbi:MAG: acyltransferase family protein [Oscillospiraceae bacterium]|nr:acyltransferase family protein [Oscillospiraceae bacterium]
MVSGSKKNNHTAAAEIQPPELLTETAEPAQEPIPEEAETAAQSADNPAAVQEAVSEEPAAPQPKAAAPAKRERDSGIDLVKICAMYFVLSLHFCLYGGFYGFAMAEKSVAVISGFRMLSYECVPLFLIISGFLMGNAKPTAKHYIKITPIVVNSMIIAAITIAFKILVLQEHWEFYVWAESVYHLQQPGYGWYVNMFIPLYLMMPFINAAYRGMQTKKAKIGALIVLIFVANLAISVNRFRIIQHPEEKVAIGFTPNYFGSIWPFAYYWTGLMIAEYRPRIKKWILLPVLVLLLTGEVLLDRFTTDFGWDQGVNFTNEDFLNIFVAGTFFLLLYDIKIRNKIVRGILKAVASLSMTVYLLSYIGDCIYVRHFLEGENTPAIFVQRYFKIIPLHFLLTVLASFPVFYLGKLISWLIMKPLLWLSSLPERRKQKSAAAS